MPCRWYSIGSSTVMILRVTAFSASSPVYSVVVLPLPVGPVTSTMPFGSSSAAPNWRMTAWRQAEAGVVERDGGAVEDPQHHGLAMQGGDRGDAEIHVLAAHRQLDAAVLRHAALGDVQPRHDLDAGGDRRGQVARRRLRLVQHAVIAVADAQAVLERLDMDVGGLGLHRPGDQQVDQPDHRRLARQVLQPIGVVFQGGLGVGGGWRGFGSVRVQPVHRRFQFDRHGDLHLHAAAGRGGDGRGDEGSSGSAAASTSVSSSAASGMARAWRRKAGPRRSGGPAPNGIAVGNAIGRTAAWHRRPRAALGDQAELDQDRIQTPIGIGRGTAGAVEGPLVTMAKLEQNAGERVKLLIGDGCPHRCRPLYGPVE